MKAFFKVLTGSALTLCATMREGGTLLLGTEGAFIGPGHAGLFEENGKAWFTCHFYDGTKRGAATLAIRPLRWDAAGWPLLDPLSAPAAQDSARDMKVDVPGRKPPDGG